MGHRRNFLDIAFKLKHPNEMLTMFLNDGTDLYHIADNFL